MANRFPVFEWRVILGCDINCGTPCTVHGLTAPCGRENDLFSVCVSAGLLYRQLTARPPVSEQAIASLRSATPPPPPISSQPRSAPSRLSSAPGQLPAGFPQPPVSFQPAFLSPGQLPAGLPQPPVSSQPAFLSPGQLPAGLPQPPVSFQPAFLSPGQLPAGLPQPPDSRPAFLSPRTPGQPSSLLGR